ncbi:hypothetical protein CO110_07895 [Candidatus Desantisbacteria bacterium CG_4_9_14_3_um_filter_40_11]|uniref:Uncharacterized protein n=1 Tax=Candidatus Desantisbacteria bacterium CG_4_9_14_3_um_filter_40_11 TaxID=1974546 RepID=A0A2M8ASG1_9BACT|nr:MAG: hypothetical protein CO110_07895 [Candidatus Desantisbacteria bacterium CG_4_9_14_3_um_filter_40_11]
MDRKAENMNAKVLKNLDLIKKNDFIFAKNILPFSKLEYEISALILENKNLGVFVSTSAVGIKKLLASIKGRTYPFRALPAPRLPKSKKPKKEASDIFKQFHATYKLDATFSDHVTQIIMDLKTYTPNGQSVVEISFPDTWSLHKISLAKRTILLGLAQAWTKDETDEPILRKLSKSLKVIAQGSNYAVSESLNQICLAGNLEYVRQQESITTFFKDLNDDKSGNILDNLVISQSVYQSLLNDGWKPDRYELENFPVTFEMFLDFMIKKGFTSVKDIGDQLEIDLNSSIENYRYRGTPFLSKDDLKKAKIIAPGWQYKGKLIIRPKVSEISS